jgi:hypothetical protein
MLVRTIEVGPSPRTWEVFAMAKRGGDYNQDGARGWEFFLLSLSDSGSVRIIARGQNPTSGHEDRYTLGENTTCNSCHGLEDARPYDSVLSLPLRPGR